MAALKKNSEKSETTPPPTEQEALVTQEIDSDWEEDLSHEDEDSVGEDSVRNLGCYIHQLFIKTSRLKDSHVIGKVRLSQPFRWFVLDCSKKNSQVLDECSPFTLTVFPVMMYIPSFYKTAKFYTSKLKISEDVKLNVV